VAELLFKLHSRVKPLNSSVSQIEISSPDQPVQADEPASVEAQKDLTALSPLDREFIGIFVRVVTLLGMPRSLGEIYGLLYSSPDPLPFDGIVTKLGISTGSASKGLRVLREMGAIRVIYQPRDRRDHYTAEIAMRMLVNGFLREKVEPHLAAGFQSLEGLSRAFEQNPPLNRDHYRQRIELLRTLQDRAKEFLPVVFQVLE
jgi:DNA-binding transcriptional regulator GbsR (MarR family)